MTVVDTAVILKMQTHVAKYEPEHVFSCGGWEKSALKCAFGLWLVDGVFGGTDNDPRKLDQPF